VAFRQQRTNQNSSSGFGSFSSFGSSTNVDLTTSAGLLELARAKGGAVSEAAEELAHPTTGILSTVSDTFKNSFKKFIDVISVPNQIVAGVLSDDYTVGEAIDQNISTSDVIFGQADPNATRMQKVGGFLVRTATDIVLDPLTYVTFGAGSGIAGLRATTKVTLGEKAAAQLGKKASAAAAVSDEGQQVYKYLKAVEAQKNGLAKGLELTERLKNFKNAKAMRGPGEIYDLADEALDDVLKKTIDAPLDPDFAKKALTNLLEKAPHMAETIIDKGGIKFFGKSVLSGQRINAAMEMIPGFTFIDNLTAPIRSSVTALFDPAMVKTDSGWVRLPEEYVGLETKARDLAESLKDDRLLKLPAIVKANNLNTNEAKFLTAAVEAGKLPTDERLARAYKQLQGFSEKEFEFLKKSGIPVAFRDNHVPHMLVPSKIQAIPFTRPLSDATGAVKQRTIDQTIFKSDDASLDKLEQVVLGEKDQKVIDNVFKEMKNSGMEIFDDNIITAHVARSMDNIKASTAKLLMREVASKMGAYETVAPQGWVKLNAKKIKDMADFDAGMILGSEGEHILFHPAVAKRIEDFAGAVITDPASNEFLKAFDGLQNLWKASVTAIFPAFHGRNAISNVFLHMMDLGVHSLNPAIHSQAAQLVYLDRKFAKLQAEAMAFNPASISKKATVLPSNTVEDMADFVVGTKKDIDSLYSKESQLNQRIDLGRAREPFVPAAERQGVDIPRGADELIAKLRADTGFGMSAERQLAREGDTLPYSKAKQLVDKTALAIPREQIDAIQRFVDDIGEHMFDDVGLQIFKNGGQQGQYEFGRSVVSIFKKSITENGGKFDRTVIHELWHSLSRFLPEDQIAGVKKTFERDKKTYIKSHPEWEKLLDNAGGMTTVERDAFIKEFPKAEPFLKKELDSDYWKTMYSNETYRLKNIDEWFAENLTDKTFDRFKAMDSATRSVFGHMKNLVKSFISGIQRAFGRDKAGKIMDDFLSRKNDELIRDGNLGMSDSMLFKEGLVNGSQTKVTNKAQDELYELMTKKLFTDATGHEWSFGELREAIKTNGVAFGGKFSGAMDVTPIGGSDLFPGMKNMTVKKGAKKAIKAPVDAGFAVGKLVEEQARLVDFIANLKNTGDVTLAAQRTKMFLFDYQNLTNFERTFLRRMIPFYTFTRKNLELQARSLVTTPGRVAAQAKTIQTLGDVLSGGELTEEEKAALPDWVTQGVGILSKKKGSTVEILTGLGTPLEQPFVAFQPNVFLGSISPLVRTPVEQMSGYSFFQGKMLSDVTNAAAFKSAPPVIKDLIGFTEIKGKRSDGSDFTWYVSLRPERMNLILNFPYARILSSVKQMQTVDVSEQNKIMQQLIGVRPYAFDVEQEAAKREKETRDKLEKLLDKANVVATYKRAFIPKDDKQKDFKGF